MRPLKTATSAILAPALAFLLTTACAVGHPVVGLRDFEQSDASTETFLLLNLFAFGLVHSPTTNATAPNTVSDLVLWLDAETSLNRNGGTVADWTDRSGNNITFAQSTPNQQPADITIGTRAAIGCDGVNDELSAGNATALNISGDESWTFVTVIQLTSTSTNFQGVFSKRDPGGSVTNPMFLGIEMSATTARLGVTSDVAEYPISTATGLTIGSPAIISGVRTGRTEILAYLNGSLSGIQNSTIAGSLSSAGNLTLCNQDGTVNYFNGRIGEVIVYRRALSAGERSGVECYLAGRYGVSVAGCF